MAGGTAAWIDVIPNMAVFAKTFSVGATAAGRSAGVSAGRSFSAGLSEGSSGGAGAAAMVKDLETASKKAQSIVAAETAKIGQARNTEKAAAESVAAAEARLAEQRAKFGETSSQALKAESQLTTAMGRQETAALRVTSAEDQLKAAIREQTVVTDQLSEAQANLVREEDVATASAGRFRLGTASAGEAVTTMGSKFGGVLKTVGSLGAMFGAFEIAHFGIDSLKSATQFQSAMTLLVTAGGEAQSKLSMVSAGVEKVAESTGTSLEQLSEGMYTIEKAGIHGAGALNVLKGAAQGAAAEGTDLATMTQALTGIMKSYGDPTSKAVSVTNELVAASGESKTTMQDFASSLSSVLPLGSKVGLSFAQIGGAIATITSHSETAQQATQNLNNLVTNLAGQNGVASVMMQQLGINVQDLAGNLGKRGLTGTLAIVNKAIADHTKNGMVDLDAAKENATAQADLNTELAAMPATLRTLSQEYNKGTLSYKDYYTAAKDMGSAQFTEAQNFKTTVAAAKGFNQQLTSGKAATLTQTQALQKMLGGMTGMRVAMMLGGSSAKQFADDVDKVTEAGKKNGSNISTWAATQATFRVQLAKLGQTVDVTGTQIATKMLPGLTSFVKSIITGTQATISFVSANKGWILPLAAGIAAIALSMKGAALAVGVWGAATKVATALSFAWTAVTEGTTAAMAGLDVAMDANPIGLVALAIEVVIAALTALVIGVIYAYNHWTWFRDGVNAVWSAISIAATWAWTNVLQPIFGGIWAAVQVVGAVFSWLWVNIMSPVWTDIAAVVTWSGGVLFAIFDLIWHVLSDTLGPIFTWLWQTIIAPAFNGIGAVVKYTWDTFLSPIFTLLKDWAEKRLPGAFSAMKDGIGDAWNALKDLVKEPIDFIVNTVINKGLIDPFNTIALKFHSATINPLVLPKGMAGGGVIPGFQSAKRDDVMMPMRRGEGVLVPEVVRALGAGFVHRLNAAGNSGGVGAVRSMAQGGLATGGIVGDITSFLSNPLGALTSGVNSLLSGIPGAGAMVDLGKGAVSTLVSAAGSFISSMFGAGTTGDAGGSQANPTGSAVTRWKPDVIAALAANGLSTSDDLVQKVLRQIQTESGGNPAAVQHGYTDVNTISGDLAKGLMQTISTTFAAYEFPGHGDIFNGYDNMLAALNYAKHTYGSNLNGLGEGHGYAEGGVIPTLFDEGGIIPQGTSLVANHTRKPEYALPEQRFVDIVQQATGGPAAPHYEPHFHNEGRDFTERDYLNAQHKMAVLAGGR
jgi:TP901 family phage tail tape measure protein